MVWHDAPPFFVFMLTFVASILSGMTGGGGGYVVTPLFIALGLTPQQSIATAKLWALGIDSGSIAAFRKRKTSHKKLAMWLIVVAIPVALVTVLAIRNLKNDNLQLAMGVLNILMIPILFIKHHKLKSHRRDMMLRGFGFAMIIGLMLLQGIFASGVGSLINVVLIAIYGVSALETNFIKRRASLVTDIIVLAGLFGTGLIHTEYGFIGLAGGLAGGFVGARFALHEGEKFARYALMVFMLVSGIWLAVTA